MSSCRNDPKKPRWAMRWGQPQFRSAAATDGCSRCSSRAASTSSPGWLAQNWATTPRSSPHVVKNWPRYLRDAVYDSECSIGDHAASAPFSRHRSRNASSDASTIGATMCFGDPRALYSAYECSFLVPIGNLGNEMARFSSISLSSPAFTLAPFDSVGEIEIEVACSNEVADSICGGEDEDGITADEQEPTLGWSLDRIEERGRR